MISADNL